MVLDEELELEATWSSALEEVIRKPEDHKMIENENHLRLAPSPGSLTVHDFAGDTGVMHSEVSWLMESCTVRYLLHKSRGNDG